MLTCMSCLYVWEIMLCQSHLCKYFLPCCGLSFHVVQFLFLPDLLRWAGFIPGLIFYKSRDKSLRELCLRLVDMRVFHPVDGSFAWAPCLRSLVSGTFLSSPQPPKQVRLCKPLILSSVWPSPSRYFAPKRTPSCWPPQIPSSVSSRGDCLFCLASSSLWCGWKFSPGIKLWGSLHLFPFFQGSLACAAWSSMLKFIASHIFFGFGLFSWGKVNLTLVPHLGQKWKLFSAYSFIANVLPCLQSLSRRHSCCHSLIPSGPFPWQALAASSPSAPLQAVPFPSAPLPARSSWSVSVLGSARLLPPCCFPPRIEPFLAIVFLL